MLFSLVTGRLRRCKQKFAMNQGRQVPSSRQIGSLGGLGRHMDDFVCRFRRRRNTVWSFNLAIRFKRTDSLKLQFGLPKQNAFYLLLCLFMILSLWNSWTWAFPLVLRRPSETAARTGERWYAACRTRDRSRARTARPSSVSISPFSARAKASTVSCGS
jgi:hypothetical protein